MVAFIHQETFTSVVKSFLVLEFLTARADVAGGAAGSYLRYAGPAFRAWFTRLVGDQKILRPIASVSSVEISFIT